MMNLVDFDGFAFDNVHPIVDSARPTVSRYGRVIQHPISMKDYEVSNVSDAYSIDNFVSYDQLSKSYLISISKLVEPESFC